MGVWQEKADKEKKRRERAEKELVEAREMILQLMDRQLTARTGDELSGSAPLDDAEAIPVGVEAAQKGK
jgi:hypothetical protein